MIGQKHNLEYIEKLKSVPHFIVIVGDEGSGKTTLSRIISDKLQAQFSVVGIKVDDIREVIDTAYHSTDRVLYCIQNADTMRNEGKNALLKITEEPPENAWFILTVQDDSSLLDTIKSRAVVIQMEPYTDTELIEYYKSKYDGIPKYIPIATTPHELDTLVKYGKDFLEYVQLVFDNIAEVQPANAFKSSSKLALKSDEGYDLKLFFKAFNYMCMRYLKDDMLKYAKGVCCTAPYILKLSKLGVNKQQIYDSWVFDIRKEWSDL